MWHRRCGNFRHYSRWASSWGCCSFTEDIKLNFLCSIYIINFTLKESYMKREKVCLRFCQAKEMMEGSQALEPSHPKFRG